MKKALLTAGAIASLATAASAQQVIGVNNLADNNFATGADTLITFDFSNPGAFVPTGLPITTPTGVGLTGIGGLDFDGNVANPTLYASNAFGAVPGEMYTVDPNTGVATSIGVVAGAAVDGLNDLAWDPVTQDMYAVAGNTLWANVDDPANAVSLGALNIPNGLDVGLSFDSQGNIHVHDIVNDIIYAGAGATTSVTPLHSLPFDSSFSQGLFIDWSRDDQGYHAAIDAVSLTAPNFLFDSLASGGGTYGPFVGEFNINAVSGLPDVEVGDLTRAPIPAPGAMGLLAIAGIASARRRR
jgi:hypothetical protein